MRHYQSLDEIREASVEELRALPAMNEKAARSVYAFFHKETGSPVEAGIRIWYDKCKQRPARAAAKRRA